MEIGAVHAKSCVAFGLPTGKSAARHWEPRSFLCHPAAFGGRFIALDAETRTSRNDCITPRKLTVCGRLGDDRTRIRSAERTFRKRVAYRCIP